jgi:Spy/CpxP family protein refolding chaperone
MPASVPARIHHLSGRQADAAHNFPPLAVLIDDEGEFLGGKGVLIMRARKNWILIGAIILTLAAATAWSQGVSQERSGQPQWQRGPQMRGMMAPPDMQKELGLSDEQVSQLRTLRFEAAKAGLQAQTDVKLKRLELRELMRADEPNQAAIDKALRGLADAQYALMKNRIQHQLAMRQVLTPEQRKKAEGMKRQFMRHWMGRRFLERRGTRGPRGRGFGMEGFGQGPGPMSFAPSEEGFGPEFESDFGPDLAPDFEPGFELPVEPPQEPGS